MSTINFGDNKLVEAGGSTGLFGGASAEGKLVSDVEWSKSKTAKFDVLAGVGACAAGTAGAGIEGKFVFTYKDGKVKFETGVMATLGFGGKVGLSFELGVDKAIELFSHIFRSIDWHRVNSVTLLAFEFYVNVAFAQFIAAGKVSNYLFEKTGDVTGWIANKLSNEKEIAVSKKNIRINVNDTTALKNAPPEALGRLLRTITKTQEDDDFDAILKVLHDVESDHELKWVLRSAQDTIVLDKTSTDGDKGKAIQAGIKRLMDFGSYSDEDNRKISYLRSLQILFKANTIHHPFNEDL